MSIFEKKPVIPKEICPTCKKEMKYIIVGAFDAYAYVCSNRKCTTWGFPRYIDEETECEWKN